MPNRDGTGDSATSESDDERVPLRVGEKQDVLARRLRVEVDPGAAGKTHPLDEGTLRVPDHEDEGAPGPGIVERNIDLARGLVEVHVNPDGRGGGEHQVLRKVLQRDRHDPRTPAPHKRLAVEGTAGARC
jgi:hypothetical protein